MSRSGSLCSGILGLDLAAEAAYGCDLAWVAEVDAGACQIIERERPGVPNLGDLTTVDWSTVEPVEIITAGYPCQPFSHAGKRKGASDARHLWPHVAEAIRVLRPRRVVLENVRGHLTLGFDAVLGDLAEAGFDAEWCVLRASDVGAPHHRARLFIVAADARGQRHGQGQDDRAVGRVDRGDAVEAPQRERARAVAVDRGGPTVAWGDLEPAIRRWEHAVGRPAPEPTDDRGQLRPPFVEWMMGYPAGWVDGLAPDAALKALGNAVVPQQGAAAIGALEACL